MNIRRSIHVSREKQRSPAYLRMQPTFMDKFRPLAAVDPSVTPTQHSHSSTRFRDANTDVSSSCLNNNGGYSTTDLTELTETDSSSVVQRNTVSMISGPFRLTKLMTGCTYQGSWNQLGMNGCGRYVFPDGMIYTGNLRDGQFDGRGELTFGSGARIEGVWSRGTNVRMEYIFADGLRFRTENWKYCSKPDRRYV